MDDAARKRLFEEFKHMITTESVVGQPIYLGDAVIVPFVDVSFGFGSGQTGAEGKSGGEAGGGRITPTAVLILKGERVELFSIKNAASTTTVDKVLNMVPEIISHFRKKKGEGEAPAAEKEAEAPASAEAPVPSAAPEEKAESPAVSDAPAGEKDAPAAQKDD